MESWLDPCLDADQMRATDRWAIQQQGVPSLQLMETAGRAVAEAAAEAAGPGRAAIVCGKGNNGGDGYVAGRLLRGMGRQVRVLMLAPADEHRGDAAENLRRLEGAAEPFAPGALDDATVIVDAILGTGFAGEPRGAA
ncbi:MAG TPA: NAD(P)H-hydrate epimerase, partial [Solirubrobacterales bacterium]|nr:NAD(P)H-hydrate epimerase [Solirubrobacterales bacterium]